MSQTMQRRGGPEPLRKPPKNLPFPLSLYQTAVGKKWVMALTGIGLLGFVVAHMVGNLHVYEGPLEVHEYAEGLRNLGGDLIPHGYVLWVMRIGLIVMFGLHIHSAYTLADMSRKANKNYGTKQDFAAANFASRSMRWTGPIVALYILFHLADLTWGWLWDDWEAGDPYNNVVVSMDALPIAIIYIVANVALAVHIFHGAWSMFQSLGLNNPKFNMARKGFAAGIAGLILVGNLSFPILVQAGLIDQDNCEAPCGITAAEAHAEEAAE